MATKKTIRYSAQGNDGGAEFVYDEESDKTTFILYVDDTKVEIPMDSTLFEKYRSRFPKRTDAHKERHRTLMSLMRFAYRQGLLDGQPKE